MAALGRGCCWLPAWALMLLIVPLLGFQTVQAPGSSRTFNRTVGGSVQLLLNLSLSPSIREIEWNWYSDKERLLVVWRPGTPSEWYDFECKNKFDMVERFSLSVVNLTVEMSGLYEARIKFRSGEIQKETFRLFVYEIIPQPHILIHSASHASDWCNVSLECWVPGGTEHLAVTWLDRGRPVDPEDRGALARRHSSSRNLSLSLLRSQSDGPLTCVVSNSVDQRNATLDLGSICPLRGSHQSKGLWIGLLAAGVIVSLGAGVWIWKRKRMETERAAPWAPPSDDSAHLHTGDLCSSSPLYSKVSRLRHFKTTEKRSNFEQSPKPALAAQAIYEEIQKHPTSSKTPTP